MLKKIWEPIRIRQLVLPNRIVMGSMHLGMEGSQDGLNKLTAFYSERAKGEAGLIVTGGIAVNKEGAGGKDFLYLHGDEMIEKLSELPRAIHQNGGRIAAQLFHAGRYSDKRGTGLDPVAPSPIQASINETPPRELSSDEIMNTIEDFAQAARRAKEAGFDAVEIMGSEGYLINQFLSPVTNHRSDEWGGHYENRSRFGKEIAKKVRETVGGDFPVLFRMSGLDLMPNSTTMEETVQFAKDLEAAGVDVLNIGIGWHESQVPTIAMFVPKRSFAWVSEKIRQHVAIPVITSNRINKLEIAEDILQTEQADLVSMARPFLADPYLLVKAKEGQLDEIRTCVACNQACLDHVFTGQPVSCVLNPSVGQEWDEQWRITPLHSGERKKVAVIGAGPAGLEAARVLAERGYQVSIFEEQKQIGGQLNFAKLVPGKEEWKEALSYYETQLQKLNISVHLGIKINSDELLKGNYDHIVIATGSQMKEVDIKGVDLPHVVSYRDLFEKKTSVGKHIVIIGAGGIAVDLSHYLMENSTTADSIQYLMEYQILGIKDVKDLIKGSRNITMMRRKGRIGEGLGRTTRWAVLQQLSEKGVKMLTGVEYKEITEKGVKIIYKGKEECLMADTVILATGQTENNHLYHDLLNNGASVSVIGGAREAGELDAKKAIYEGARLGRMLS